MSLGRLIKSICCKASYQAVHTTHCCISLGSQACNLGHATMSFLLQIDFLIMFTHFRPPHMRLRQNCPCSDFIACHIMGDGGWRVEMGWDKWDIKKKVNHIWYYVSCCSNLSIPFIFLSVCHMNMCEHRLKHCKSYAAVFSPFTQCICVPWCLYS